MTGLRIKDWVLAASDAATRVAIANMSGGDTDPHPTAAHEHACILMDLAREICGIEAPERAEGCERCEALEAELEALRGQLSEAEEECQSRIQELHRELQEQERDARDEVRELQREAQDAQYDCDETRRRW